MYNEKQRLVDLQGFYLRLIEITNDETEREWAEKQLDKIDKKLKEIEV